MSIVDLIDEDDNESGIAAKAANVLRDCFIAAAQRGTVLYVENDNLMSKTPNGVPILVKHLDGRNPDLAYRLAGRRTFKIKKRKINSNWGRLLLPFDRISNKRCSVNLEYTSK